MLGLHVPAVILAPMEGLTDAPMRAVLSAAGGFTHCVSEFVRVSHSVLGAGVFRKRVPELLNGARTPAGTPVQVQLLGGDRGRVAESAANAVSAGATAIDLNFGCPAPTVNRHDGGATLLKDPPRVRAVVRAVRDAVPADIPVSAKMRLGWDRTDTIFETSAMAAEGGASWITIHARTRMQGYAPPVDWGLIGRVRERLRLPVVANGDIGSVEAFRRCREETGCVHFMLGRGAVADPGLAGRVAAELGLDLTPRPPLHVWRGGVQPAQVAGLPRHEGECEAVARSQARGEDQERFPVEHPLSMMERGLGGEVSEHHSTPHWPTLLRQLPTAHPAGVLKRLKQWLRIATAYGTFRHFEAVKRAASVDELLAVVDDLPHEVFSSCSST